MGKIISCKSSDGKETRYVLTVVEAYLHDDKACYKMQYKSPKGKARRYLEEDAETWFIYSGMIHVVCKGVESGDNVLIRGVVDISNPKFNIHDNGKGQPWNLRKTLGKSTSDGDLLDSLVLYDNGIEPIGDYKTGKRIGLKEEKVGCYATKPWRFYLTKEQINEIISSLAK